MAPAELKSRGRRACGPVRAPGNALSCLLQAAHIPGLVGPSVFGPAVSL